jgi:hypothetical protein
MLPAKPQFTTCHHDEAGGPDEVAQGLAAEVRSDMADAGGQVTQQVQDALDTYCADSADACI